MTQNKTEKCVSFYILLLQSIIFCMKISFCLYAKQQNFKNAPSQWGIKLPKRGALDQHQISDMGGCLQQKRQQQSATSPFEWFIK